MKDKYIKAENIFKAIFVVVIVVSIAITVSSTITARDKHVTEHNYTVISDGWINKDGDSVSVPFVGLVKANTSYTISNKLPKFDYEENLTVSFFTYFQEAKVYVDGELKFEYIRPENQKLGKFLPKSIVFVPIDKGDSGKRITIELISPYSFNLFRISNIIYGSESEIKLAYMNEDFIYFIGAIITLFMGVVFIVFSIFRCIKKRLYKEFFHFSNFIVLMGIFLLADSIVFRTWVLNSMFCTLIYMHAFMFLPLPYLLYLMQNQKGTELKASRIIGYIYSAYLLIIVILEALNITDVLEVSTLTQLMLYGFAVYAFIIKYRSGRKIPAVLFMTLLVMSAISYQIQGKLAFVVYLFVIAYSLYNIYLLCANIIQMEKIAEINRIKIERAENELFVNQINNHFFFHILSSARVLIKVDPDKAYKMITNLSKYIRYRTDSVEKENGLTYFPDEMQAVYSYVAIKKEILGDRLKCVFSMDTIDFYIPVLSIQPIIENAIEHGIESKPGGGTLTVSSYDEKNCHVVVIQDDGIGFDPSIVDNDMSDKIERHSVSMQNIEKRLSYYGSGNSIKIESKCGVGTTVTVKFIKNMEDNYNENNIG